MDGNNLRGVDKFDLHQRRQTETSSPLHQIKMSSVFYTHSTMKQPWGIKMPSIPSSTMFHLILNGEAIVSVYGARITLGPGDFILLPRGTGHEIVDVNNTPAIDLFENNLEKVTEHYERLTTSGSGDITTTLCGTVLFDNDITTSIISSMPNYILITAQSDARQTIESVVQAIQRETIHEDYGAGLIVSRLADVLILQCIRAWINDVSEENQNWIMAHTDKRLSRAMKKIHGDPATNIDIESLARLSGMSRTSFIEYFKKTVGQTPKKYITDWRLSLARERLSHSREHVLNIALEVGYQSEAAFSRAYKAKYGESPSHTKKIGYLKAQA
ncbi:AraC family transcriptional regulator [Enterovibrio sp. ZSDZ35]|uniref:AraC family transcriptional regulator n=1 Tax=Enterovibrio qingdaonensis TaxID=2899818 RepID=A0ABT5QR74_9GAMM|nr:AraC family transcriptional regulator [Enterovibrio sp. ZSDZ35]MDD1783183.1 AraC family transcriptional regulator [Enterovibrio sp. ZSDZ35]